MAKTAAIGVRKQVRGGVSFGTPPFFRTKKLALIGRTDSAAYAPWHDPSWTIAAHPCARTLCKREPDWYFDMHRPACFETQGKAWNESYYTWLKALQTPVFMQERWPGIPMAVRYPIERILSEFRAYFTNHPAYMIALAMTEGVTHIGMFGCEYSADTEHSTQRGSAEYWLGRFEQAGGNVIIPAKRSTLLAFPAGLYGYESHDDKGRLCGDYIPKLRATEMKPNGTKRVVTMTPVDLSTPEAQALIPRPPNGEPIAWERVGAVVN